MTIQKFFEDYRKPLIVGAVAATLGGVAIAGLQILKRSQEGAAQEAYYAVESRYLKIREGFDEAKFKALNAENGKKDPPDEVNASTEKAEVKAATGNLEQDYGSVINDLTVVAKEHAGLPGGVQAALLLADIYMSYDQPEKAVEVIQGPAKSLDSSHLLAVLSRILWGNAMAAQGDCQGAVGVWQEVIDNKTASFLHADVGLRAGICFEKLSQFDKAAEMYRRVSSSGVESTAAQTAKGLLRALELRSPVSVEDKQG